MNIIKSQRESLGYTQAELAERSGLSLRTVQRIEVSDLPPKGYTLKMFAQVFDLDTSYIKENFICGLEDEETVQKRLKILNLSVLGFFLFPFGNIFFPLFLWYKWSDDALLDEVARKIINCQILWTITMCLGLSIAPFIDGPRGLILYILFAAMVINIIIVGFTAFKIQNREYDFPHQVISFL